MLSEIQTSQNISYTPIQAFNNSVYQKRYEDLDLEKKDA